MEDEDTAYLEWLELDFKEFDKIPAQQRRKDWIFQFLCGVGMCGLLGALMFIVGWLHNTAVALR